MPGMPGIPEDAGGEAAVVVVVGLWLADGVELGWLQPVTTKPVMLVARINVIGILTKMGTRRPVWRRCRWDFVIDSASFIDGVRHSTRCCRKPGDSFM
jgi:hypothetical protein